MKQETTNKKERNMKKVGLVIAATTGTVCTIGLGALCVVLAKDNKNLKLENSIAKEAYEGIAEKFIQQTEVYEELVKKTVEQNETIELVKNVVGGTLINRLITNEEKVLSRLFNKKDRLVEQGLDKIAEKALEDLNDRIQNSLETITDYKSVKDVLHK